MRDVILDVVRPMIWAEAAACGLFFLAVLVWTAIGAGA